MLRLEGRDDLPEVVHALRARLPVVLELDGLHGLERRRTLDFLTGVAYGLDVSVSEIAETPHAYLLEPRSHPRERRDRPRVATPPRVDDGAPQASPPKASKGPASVCVLCDLRPATKSFESPLDMVIRRDGSRIVSPPAFVCDHCSTTIRHWRFMLAWCPECERWGRRGVRSACGVPYG
jgi:hypothetical protein